MNPGSSTIDFASIIHGHLSDLTTANIALFTTAGLALLAGFSIMLIVWKGIKMALDGNGINWTLFIGLAFQIATVSALLHAYSTRVGWLGNQSVIEVIADGPTYFADKIGTQSAESFNKAYADWTTAHPESAGSSVSSALSIISAPFDAIILMVLMFVFRALLALVLMWGSVAQGVCIIIGPLFIPFLLFDKLSFLFWGWFRCFLQYSFYQLIGTLVANLMCMFMIDAMTQFGAAGAAVGLIPWAILAIFALLSVPALVSSLFSGTSSAPSLNAATMLVGRLG